ncbi:MAG: NYN domain-containing protein [Eggerthellaceae bacterium]|nr:NYN domain-containing protein [Eggerthellaceae bacterium]
MFATEIIGNFAYIDNQNLYMATQRADDPWDIDMRRFRVYLKEKYNVVKAYLFMGAFELSHQEMYSRFNDYGYALVFREHSESLKGKKKGNVDVDVVFEMMRDSFTNVQMRKIILVSGDGDYFRTVSYLVKIDKFAKVILPSHKGASSLYKQLSDHYRVYLDSESMKRKMKK